tara:strand:+ start:74 stop:436 length:363 start_codon:yes stop_codon:yes gene_type:complete
MRLFYRLGYYLAGFSVGLIFLVFIFSGKKTSCNYSPSARVKNNFLQKKIEIPPKINMKYPYLNDSILKVFIAQGKIDFIKSDTKLDSCKTYHINIAYHEDSFLKVANCKKKLIVIRAKLP